MSFRNYLLGNVAALLMLLIEQRGQIDAHERRAPQKARTRGDLNAPTGKQQLGRLDACPCTVRFFPEMCDEVLQSFSI